MPVSYQPINELFCVRATYEAVDPNDFTVIIQFIIKLNLLIRKE